MKTLWLAWAVGLVMMVGSAIFVYNQWKEIADRVKSYKEKQAEKPSRWRYLTWLDLSIDVLIGGGGQWNLISMLIVFLFGAIIFVTSTMQIIMGSVG